jgi:hypothetical protein
MPPGSSSRCVRSNEIVADQFAFWATGRRGVRSSYGVPPLLHRAELGAWFARLLPPWQRSPSGWTVPGQPVRRASLDAMPGQRSIGSVERTTCMPAAA